MTAGNSTPLTDGAAAVLLASDEWAAERSLPVLAHLVARRDRRRRLRRTASEGLLMAPVYAVPRLLERHGLTLQDFDFYEIHEAFASQVLATLKAWEDPASARAAGPRRAARLDRPRQAQRQRLARSPPGTRSPRPAAGSSPRSAKLLDEKGSGRGLISICAAGGQGVVAVMEK